MSVALFIATIVALLLAASVLDALPLVFGSASDVADAGRRSVDAARRSLVRDFAVLSAPSGIAGAIVVADAINAATFLTRVVSAFVPKNSHK